jgi:hypothetical protein
MIRSNSFVFVFVISYHRWVIAAASLVMILVIARAVHYYARTSKSSAPLKQPKRKSSAASVDIEAAMVTVGLDSSA